MSLMDVLHQIAGGLGNAAHGVSDMLEHSAYSPSKAFHSGMGPRIANQGYRQSAIYQPVSNKHGFFRDQNAGSGWSFSNGEGDVLVGTHAPGFQHAVIGENGGIGREGYGTQAYTVQRASALSPDGKTYYNPGGAKLRYSRDQMNPQDHQTENAGGLLGLGGLLASLAGMAAPVAGAAAVDESGMAALNAPRIAGLLGRGGAMDELGAGSRAPMLPGGGAPPLGLPSAARPMLNPGPAPINAQQALRDYIEYLATGRAPSGSIL